MISRGIQQILSTLLCATLLVLGAQPASAFQTEAGSQTSTPAPSPAPTPAPLTTDQLNSLVAPIALYPDALVAQVLGAATFPEQVAIADYWVAQNKTLTGTALAQAVDQQPWDASVKALTQFPSVLDNMASNLVWTSNLGQAFHDQQAQVMAAVQVMRAKAQAAGTLQSTPQIKVVQQTPQTIVIQPANPQVVYVPRYNPTIVYGAPVIVPLYTPPVPVAVATVSFGAGVALGAAFGGVGYGGVIGGGGGGFAWGFNAWHCNWGGGGGGGNIIYNNNTYISNNTWHGGNTYNNYHPWGPGPHGPGPYGPHPYSPNGFRPNGDHYVPTRDQPNGGRNGDHGLIGGNGGVEHPPNGGNNGNHGMIGGQGGVQHLAQREPNGGANGNHGLLGGNEARRQGSAGGNQFRSRMSGDGAATRAESNRGRSSMRGGMERRPVMRASAPHRNFGGGGGRRR